MSSRASLNHVYRTVWNQALGAMVAVAEIATGRRRATGSGAGGIVSPLAALPLCIAVAWGGALPNAMANPTGGVVVAGQASFNASQANKLLVTTQNAAGTNHSAINWQSFSIPQGDTTYFLQPNAASTSINRVVTSTPSQLFGTLGSNGNLVLVNQSGITVGAGAVVDTAGFTASSLLMSDADALSGRLHFGDGSASTAGVSVQGSILARNGDVVLIGSSVDTGKDALIQAPGGATLLVAGHAVSISSRGLEGIQMEVQAPSNSAVNLGTLKGDAVGIFAGTLKHSGLIQATTATLEGGRVVLKAAGDAHVQGSGSIDVSSATGKGGHIEVLGNHVAVTDAASLDASGASGGGVVLVGGDYQGKNLEVPNSTVTYVGSKASIKADATLNGDGGKVIVWADDTTRAYGNIAAQGGAQGGNGGFVEVSGKRYLDYQGRADTSAAHGMAGNLLLDPNDIIIDNSADNLAGGNFAGGVFSGGGGNPTITWATINGQAGSVEIRTNSAASVGSGDININASGTLAGPASLTLLANRAINVAPSVVVSGTVDFNWVAGWNIGQPVSPGVGNDIVFGAGARLSTSGNVSFNAGNGVSQGSGSSITANRLVIGNRNGGSLPGGINLPGTNMVNTFSAQSDGGGSLVFVNGKALIIGIGASFNGIVASGNPSPISVSTTAGNLTVNQPIISDGQGGAPVNLTAAGALALNAGITSTINASPAGSIKLVAGSGGISSTGSGVMVAADLEVLSGGAVTLNANNNVGMLAAQVSGGGAFSYTGVGPVTVGVAGATVGVTNANAGIALSGTSIALNRGVDAGAGSVKLNATAGGITQSVNGAITANQLEARSANTTDPVSLLQANQISALAIDAVGAIAVENAASTGLSITTVGSTPGLVSATGTIVVHQASPGGIAINQNVTTSGGAVTLGVTSGSGGVNLASSKTITGSIVQLSTYGGPLTIDGAINAGVEASLISGQASPDLAWGNISGLGPITAGQLLTIDAGAVSGASISLSGTISSSSLTATSSTGTLLSCPTNVIGDAQISNSSSGNIGLKSTSDLRLNVSNSAPSGSVIVQTTGNLDLSASVFANNGAVVLATGGIFTDNDASISGSSRWLVYSANPATNATLMTPDFQQYGATYPTAPMGSGNGFLYSLTGPTVTATLIGNVTKGYDANTSTVLSLGNYEVINAVSDAYVWTSDSPVMPTVDAVGSAQFADASAGTGKIVTSAGGTASAVFTSGTVYGYQFSSANGAIGTINPKGLTVGSVMAANKAYDATTKASLTGGMLSGVIPGDSVSLTAAVGTFIDKNVGLSKPVTVSGLGLTGSSAGNYVLSAASASTLADITPASVSVSGVAAHNKVYDANTAAAFTGGILSGVFPGDVVTLGPVSGTFNNKNVGIAKAVTVTGVTLTGTDAGNYVLNALPAGSSADITPANLNVSSVTAQNKVYDATTGANFSGGTLSGAISGDAVSVGTITGTFLDKKVGVAKPVTVTGVTLAGADSGNYALNPITVSSSADITPAKLNLASATAKNKEYDAKTTADFTGATLSGLIGTDAVNVGALTGDFNDKNVGVAKPVTVTGVTLAGADAGNYVLNPITVGSSADISVKPLATWTGAASNNLWSDPKNWDAIPDLANVAAVSIPPGSSGVLFDASMGNLKFDSIISGSPLTMSGGSLTLKTDLSTPLFSQTGGDISGAGVFKVNGSFSQIGGSVTMGSIDITQTTGKLAFNNLNAPSVSLVAQNGPITQTGALVTAALTTTSVGGTILNDAGNKISSWKGINQGAGNIELTNAGVIDTSGLSNSGGGSIVLVNTGGVSTSGLVNAGAGSVSITANSPLTVGTDGILAEGTITLTATNLTSSGDMLLNGPVRSNAASVALSAANNLTQNGEVYGALGVKADIGGSFTAGPNAKSGVQPVSYLVNGLPINAPGVALDVPQGNLVTTFLDKFELALQSQLDPWVDPVPDKDKKKTHYELVVEGATCPR